MTARPDTYRRIVEAADRLFYERGYSGTSFADIAAVVGLSRGNFYYHFKTKDAILSAVIERRLQDARRMVDIWERSAAAPADRLLRFAEVPVGIQSEIMRHGCPAGTLCTELAKLDHVARDDATRIFTVFREWLADQFAAAGLAAEADRLAMHLLARNQGVATLAAAFGDETFIRTEVAATRAWLASEGLAAASPVHA